MQNDLLNYIRNALRENSLNIEINLNILSTYINTLMEWNKTQNITSHKTHSDIVYKDILDNLIAGSLIKKYIIEGARLMDFGAGAGFTGTIFNLLYPHIQVTYADSSRKKINFIRHCSLELGLQSKYLCQHIKPDDYVDIGLYDIVICRAVTNISEFHNSVQNSVQSSGYLIYMAGPNQKSYTNLESQFIEFEAELPYTILPYNYSRSIIIYKKK